MMPVPFTQFLRPDGRRTAVTVDRPDEIAAMAKSLLDAGCHFDIEELMTGDVSMTCEDATVEDDGALAHEVCANGPAVLVAVDTLIRTAHAAVAARKGAKR